MVEGEGEGEAEEEDEDDEGVGPDLFRMDQAGGQFRENFTGGLTLVGVSGCTLVSLGAYESVFGLNEKLETRSDDTLSVGMEGNGGFGRVEITSRSKAKRRRHIPLVPSSKHWFPPVIAIRPSAVRYQV